MTRPVTHRDVAYIDAYLAEMKQIMDKRAAAWKEKRELDKSGERPSLWRRLTSNTPDAVITQARVDIWGVIGEIQKILQECFDIIQAADGDEMIPDAMVAYGAATRTWTDLRGTILHRMPLSDPKDLAAATGKAIVFSRALGRIV